MICERGKIMNGPLGLSICWLKANDPNENGPKCNVCYLLHTSHKYLAVQVPQVALLAKAQVISLTPHVVLNDAKVQ